MDAAGHIGQTGNPFGQSYVELLSRRNLNDQPKPIFEDPGHVNIEFLAVRSHLDYSGLTEPAWSLKSLLKKAHWPSLLRVPG